MPLASRAPPRRRRYRWAVTLALAAALWSCFAAARSAFLPARPPPAASRPSASSLASLGETVVEEKVEVDESEEDLRLTEEQRKERFEILAVTLLQLSDKAEQYALDGELPVYMDFPAFKTMLGKVELDCSGKEAKQLYDMLAPGGETLCVHEMRRGVRESGTISEMYSESLRNVAYTVIPALGAAFGFAVLKGPSSGFDFLAGYVVEDSLSIDNLFVFLLLFQSFKVPTRLQTFCLNLGIYGAIFLRALFIFAGLAAVESFKPLLLFFAAFLLYSSIAALTKSDDEEDEGPPEAVNQLVGQLPTTPKFDGEKLFVKGANGQWLATPLALCIISIELCDILFAVDSVPAVFAVTEDPLIVYTSNIAAILGLRSLFRVLSVAVQDLVYLEKAVAIVLGFVGVKLAAQVAGIEINSGISLAFIVLTLAGGVFFSKLADSEEEEEPAIPTDRGV